MKKPIQMWGEEHYVKPHKDYSCSSAPIFDTEGRLLGCLNITGRAHAIHLHTLGMVISAVDGISNQLRLMTAYMELEKVSNQRNRIIETMASGLVLLNSEYEIIQVNSKFLTMLNLRNRSVIGKSLLSLSASMNRMLTTPLYWTMKSTIRKSMSIRWILLRLP